jgi:TRAP-type C4-dicarboxylate transport system permease small subunit
MAEKEFQVSTGLTALERAALITEVEEKARELELADPDPAENALNRWINLTLEAVGVAILATIAVLVFINACARYAFSSSLVWGDELVISLIPWLAMIGLFLSVRRRKVIRTGTLLEKLRPNTAVWVKAAGDLISTCVFAYLAYFAFRYLQLFGADSLIYFEIQKGIFHSALLIGGVLIALAFLADAAKTLRRRQL